MRGTSTFVPGTSPSVRGTSTSHTTPLTQSPIKKKSKNYFPKKRILAKIDQNQVRPLITSHIMTILMVTKEKIEILKKKLRKFSFSMIVDEILKKKN